MKEIIEKMDLLCDSLDKQANIELNFCVDTGIMLERMAWDLYKLANDLREIKFYRGI